MVVIGIVTKDNQVLIVRRKQKEGNLFWQFPGGVIEDEETEIQAVVREIEEETGIESKAIKCLGSRIHPSTKQSISYWICEFISGDICISDKDLDEAIWVNINDILKYFTTPIYSPIIDYLGIDNEND